MPTGAPPPRQARGGGRPGTAPARPGRRAPLGAALGPACNNERSRGQGAPSARESRRSADFVQGPTSSRRPCHEGWPGGRAGAARRPRTPYPSGRRRERRPKVSWLTWPLERKMHFRAAVAAAAAARPAATSRGRRRRLLVAPLADLRRLLAASRQLQPDTHGPLHPLGPRPLPRAPRCPRRRRPPLPRAAAAPPGPCTCLALPCAAGLPGSLTLGAGERAEPRGRTRSGASSRARARAPLRSGTRAPRGRGGRPRPRSRSQPPRGQAPPRTPPSLATDWCAPHPHPATRRSPSPNPLICMASPPLPGQLCGLRSPSAYPSGRLPCSRQLPC